jgi:hypothetical protein
MKMRLQLLTISICLLFTGKVFAQRTIHVVDYKSRAGIQSKIFKRTAGGTETSLGPTDANGMKVVAAPGAEGEELRAQPQSPRYYESSTTCPLATGETIVEVVAADAMSAEARRLFAQARTAEAQGKPAEAALALKKVANSVAKSDPALARFSEKRIALLGGAIFDVKTPVQERHDGGAWAATPQLQVKVRGFQRDQGLAQTGVLNTETLSKAAVWERKQVITPTATTTTDPR